MGPVYVPMEFEHVRSVRRQRDQLLGAHYLLILLPFFAQSRFVQVVIVGRHDGVWCYASEGSVRIKRNSTTWTDLIDYEPLYGVRISVLLG
jgi:hypothetical protein